MISSGECLDEEAAVLFIKGRMSAEQRSAAEQHFESCGACRKLLGIMASLESPGSAGPGDAARELPVAAARYTLLAEHARGGQARILLAFDENVGREVAIKELLPPPGEKADHASWRDATARFLREAELTGQLVHPGVVPVFEIGRRPDGALFYSMQLVRGRTLSEVLHERADLRDRLSLLNHFLSVCHVAAYAHSRGVLHRDIKPQNIMVGEFGETVLLDWGLAKQRGAPDAMPAASTLRAGAPSDATVEGTVVGTPGYMSPEQASGRLAEVDERSDIYGLGAVLFEILTGRPPSAADAGAALRVRALCPGAPPELAGVAEKALAPAKKDRYQQAADLAQDVTAFMTGGRVAAYTYSGRDLLRRFAVRHRLFLSAASVVLMALLAALVLASLAWRSERLSRRDAAARGHEALQEGAKLALMSGDKLQARAKVRGALELGDSLAARALWQRLRVDSERFSADLNTQVDAVGFSPDGRELAVGLQSGIVQRVDVVTRAIRTVGSSDDRVSALTYSPDGSLLAWASFSGGIALWDVARGALVRLPGRGIPFKGLAFSPDGSLLAASERGGGIHFWDARRKVLVASLAMPAEKGAVFAFSPDGGRLAASDQVGKVVLWDLESKIPLREWPGRIRAVVFSRDGALIAGGSDDGTIALWEASSGHLRRLLETPEEGRITQLATSPEGRLLAAASDAGIVRLWSLPGGELVRIPARKKGPGVTDVAFSADSALLAAASLTSITIWDLGVSGMNTEPPPAAKMNVAEFSPDGSRIFSAGTDGLVRSWDLSGELRATWAGHESSALGLCITPDGRLLASSGLDGMLIIRNAQTGAERHRISTGGPSVTVACAPDNARIASAGVDATVRIWDASSGELLSGLVSKPPLTRIFSLAFTPDGRQLVVGREFGAIEIWDPATARRARLLSGHKAGVLSLALDDQGTMLASTGVDGSVRLWNLAGGAGRLLGEIPGLGYKAAWDPRGERVAVARSSGAIDIWSLVDGKHVTFAAHREDANSVEFAPDGKTAVSAGDDGTLRLWDATTWQPKWFTRALVWAPAPQILTHQGWRAADSGNELVPITVRASDWRRAAEASREAVMRPGGPLCLTKESGLEIWDTQNDKRLMAVNLASPFGVAALPDGCSVILDGTVTLYGPGRPPIELVREASFQSGGELLAVVGSEIALFDPQGRRLESYGSGSGASALAPIGESLAVGFKGGGIELHGRSEHASVRFKETPASAVTRLIEGPSGTLAAGFADGSFGLWEVRSGERLERGSVNGAVRHLLMHEGTLVVASEMGSLASMNLSLLMADYCELLQEIWSRVPVVWRDHGALALRPDPSHRCAAGPLPTSSLH